MENPVRSSTIESAGIGAVLLLETLKVRRRHLVVGITLALLGDVDDDRRTNKAIEGILSTVWRPSAKCTGASRCVPPCSEVKKLLAA